MSYCAVFVCNRAYFNKFISTCSQLIDKGKHQGDICLVIGNDLVNSELLKSPIIINNNVIIKHFADINFSPEFLNLQKQMDRPPHWYKKLFQYHKFHLFSTFFKRWEYIFYLDCGITIFSEILPIVNEFTKDTLLAHSDAFPAYEWKLHNQFSKSYKTHYDILNNKYNLNVDYCQTTVMLYDTSLIQDDTFDNLLSLTLEFPISITNDQGIIALYFTNIKPHFKQLNTHNEYTFYYDYLSRNKHNKYIMLKSI
jgi:hypothetical protein